MNIWMFNHYAIPPCYPGGTRHFELASELVRLGHRVVIFAANFLHMNLETIDMADGGDENRGGNRHYKIDDYLDGGLRFVWLRTRSYRGNDWRRFLNMWDYCRHARRVSRKLTKTGTLGSPDVIIGSTVHPFAPLTAARLAKDFKIPFIFEIRDLWPQTFIDMGVWRETSLVARFFRRIEGKAVHRARKIITLSPLTGPYLEKTHGFPAGDICCIPNGVHIEPPPGSRGREAPSAAGGDFTVLFTGSLVASNRLESIIEAAERLRGEGGIRIKLVGRGQEEGRYRRLIEEKALENITILPPVEKSQVPALLAGADALILNQGNVQWGSSNKLYDYMVSGRPIISSVHARHNDIVRDIGGGYSVSPGDAGELAGAILRLRELSAGGRREMGRKNIDYVKKHHDWEILGERLGDLLSGVVESC